MDVSPLSTHRPGAPTVEMPLLGGASLRGAAVAGRTVTALDSGRSDRAIELAEHRSGRVDSTLDVPALLGYFDMVVEESARLRELRCLLTLLWLVMLLPDRPGHACNPAGTVDPHGLPSRNEFVGS